MLYYYIDKAVDINKNILLCRLFYSVLALGKIVYIQLITSCKIMILKMCEIRYQGVKMSFLIKKINVINRWQNHLN